MADFSEQAKAWLNDVVIASLEAAKADVAGEVAVDIDTAPRRQVKALTPSIRFQIYKKRELEKAPRRTFTVNVKVSGAVSVSSPGMVTKDVGNIGDRSDLRSAPNSRTDRGRRQGYIATLCPQANVEGVQAGRQAR